MPQFWKQYYVQVPHPVRDSKLWKQKTGSLKQVHGIGVEISSKVLRKMLDCCKSMNSFLVVHNHHRTVPNVMRANRIHKSLYAICARYYLLVKKWVSFLCDNSSLGNNANHSTFITVKIWEIISRPIDLSHGYSMP
jgi:hypothetical protein